MVSAILRRFFTLRNRGNVVTPEKGEEELSIAERYLYGADRQRRDPVEASKWLWKSVSKDNDKATLLLADLYLKGDGVSKDDGQAISLLYHAARKGVSGAVERLQALGYQLPLRRSDSLFSFIDLKDPFAVSDVAGEDVPGPILSLMNAQQFEHVFLFHTPHTRTNAIATEEEISRRHPECRIRLRELPIPTNKWRVVEHLAAAVRDVVAQDLKATTGCDTYVCVSSGTAEMRAAWFILAALQIFRPRLLQVDTPLFGQAKVTDTGEFWFVSPGVFYFISEYLRTKPNQVQVAGARPQPEVTPVLRTDVAPLHDTQLPQSDELVYGFESNKAAPGFDERCIFGLDEALRELGIHVGSAVLRDAAERAGVAASSPLPVLLLGETGVGKERFAQLIHRLSPRSSRDMVAINCAAIPKELAESHLFGHTRGAFSGAIADKKGIFEVAGQSSLFLDEVAELPLEIQAKLLRVIQDGSFQRVGSTKPLHVDVRIIAATNRDLEKEVAAGRFREDLYFRLEVLQIRLPALRERRTEIPELALALLSQINQRRLKPKQLCKDALLRLERHNWPGNVRELHNVLERSVLYAPREQISAKDLQIKGDGNSIVNPVDLPELFDGFSLEEYLSKVRSQLFHRALEKSAGHQAEAAKLLRVTRQAVSKFLAEKTDNPS
jgi:transcriptional regulator with AAA-type ATPase domain